MKNKHVFHCQVLEFLNCIFIFYIYIFQKFAKDLKDKAEKQGVSASINDIADTDPEQLLAAQVSETKLTSYLLISQSISWRPREFLTHTI